MGLTEPVLERRRTVSGMYKMSVVERREVYHAPARVHATVSVRADAINSG